MESLHSPAKDVSSLQPKAEFAKLSSLIPCFQSMATLRSWASTISLQRSAASARREPARSSIIKADPKNSPQQNENGCSKRGLLLVGMGALAATLLPAELANAEGVPDKYQEFVDTIDGYSYYYPSDWREFDFLGHDSAFKDRFAALQHVRVCFIPTDKKDVRELGPMEVAVFNLVKNVYAAPIQRPTIYDIQERSIDGKNYWTFEYELESPNFARTAFATIAIGNGRYYTLVVGANQRRWSRMRNKLKVVADSFRMIDI